MANRIIFVLPVAYPTTKAYGVSIGRTVKALNSDEYRAEIWASSSSDSDQFDNRITHIGGSKLSRINFLLSSKFKVIRTLAFLLLNLQTAKNTVRNIHKTKLESPLIVVRELILAAILIMHPKVNRVLIELHQFPTCRTKLIIRILSLSTRVELATISDQHKTLWEEKIGNKQFFLTPMGVASEFFKSSKNREHDLVRIVYVGKASSGGHDNGLLELLPSFKHVQRKFPTAVITLVGLEEDFCINFKNLALEENLDLRRIKFHPHIPHSEVPNFLENQDFGLIPYPSSPYHNARFPIKALEYAAMGLHLLVRANNSSSHIIPEKVASYFSTEKEASLTDLIQGLTADPERLKSKINLAEDWALEYTYENRASQFKKILSS